MIGVSLKKLNSSDSEGRKNHSENTAYGEVVLTDQAEIRRVFNTSCIVSNSTVIAICFCKRRKSKLVFRTLLT
jgi:hypothetical protein